MIVSFSVSNFRSFSSEETFSLVASNRLSGRHEEHAVPIPDSSERVLRTAVLYGANGAGKSNLFKALLFLRNLVLNIRGRSSGTGREVFRLGGQANEPSSFDLQFIVRDKLFRFGVRVDDQRIVQEWLVRVVGGREKTLYERITDEHGDVKIDASGILDAGTKLKALAEIGGPQNQSFLATLRATLDTGDFGDELSAILSWFSRSLMPVAPTQPPRSLGRALTRNPDLLKFASEFLKSSSTGVDHLRILKKEMSEDELRRVPKSTVARLLGSLDEGGTARFPLGSGSDLLIERTDGDRFYRLKVEAAHEGESGEVIPLELNEESDGTQRLLQLIPALHHLRKGSAVYFIDEIDRSLHPMLVRNFLEFFLNSCVGSQRQLIMTTHESSLLDQDLLRRDEIWFAEKDNVGATRLYSLMDFKVRNDLEIRKHYLQGRFGAVPFLGDPARLPVEKDQPA
jgi:AAA15 family ATPase/GTPase